jgi:hypothetical protein
MIYYIIIGVVLLFLFAWYMGTFQKLQISEDKFRGGLYVYKDWQGHVNEQAKQ